ncbi:MULTISPECIES: SMP-30/gluconolactonase/LRE family protein [unclassified Roseitalea]|uniref:SMP-30/gluconolactonase/LRE family protein n=1 Tax=unclassified Roseitalea TaxID=2639107 RepID=UPI00273D57AB|nr:MULTISPECIES: SMP-30/gluconolactonase/LRE family protein [unclassified Roseitalea]
MEPLLPMSAAKVFYDGIFDSPRLAHPEGVAVHADGSVWCGTENGDLVRIKADASAMAGIAKNDGFLLGLAFDAAGNCYACDLRHAAIFRYEAATGAFDRFADGGIAVPNYPVVDDANGWLYVSDSHGWDEPGGGIYRYDLRTGEGGLWSSTPMHFANGMAMAPDGSGLYVVESTAARLSFVPIAADGSAGAPRVVTNGLSQVPDGVLVMPNGDLMVSCYEPGRIYRYSERNGLELVIHDPNAVILAHPTNIALTGERLITASLGRWHLAEVDLSALPG